MINFFSKTPDRYYLSVLFSLLFIFPVYIIAAGRLGLKPLVLLFAMSLTGFIIETLGSIVTNKPLKYYGIICWFIFPLVIPPGIPIWMAVICFALSLILCLVLFGGFGKHLYHPVVAGQIFLLINFAQKYNASYLKPFSDKAFGFLVYSSNSFTSKTTLSLLNEVNNISFNNLLFGPNVGAIGEMFPLLILIVGLLYLLFCDVNYITPLSFIITFVPLSYIGNYFFPNDILPVIPSLLGGFTIFYLFFIFTDRWTSARTKGGRIISGFIAAVLTIIIRSFSSNIEGIMFAAIFNYSFSPLYDEIFMNMKRDANYAL